MHAVSAPIHQPEDRDPSRSTSGFGAVGRFCRAVSSVAGGWLLGSSFGLLPGIAGVLLGAAVFAFAEPVSRR